MKSIVTLITFCALWINVCAQAPQAFKYQAVARDNSGNILAEKSVKFKISIIQKTIDGEVVYSELHAKTTNSFGLVDMEIGNGSSPSGTFSAIKWGTDQFFIKVEIDPTGGTTYQTMGISQMLSVPYALYSLSSGDTCKWSSNQEKLFYNMGNVGIGTNTPSVDLEIFSTPGKAIRGMALNQYSDDRNGQMLLLRKWRGNSIVPLSLLNNDYTGALVFTGFNGTTYNFKLIKVINHLLV